MASGICSQMAHQAKLTDALQKVDCFFGNFNHSMFFHRKLQEAEEIEYILHLPPEFSM